jgi:interferon-induced GTP-binding protein Mx
MPQICVMGDQSSGKSSVLEALSGVPFPRGAGLVTRCPIRMVMRRARTGEPWSASISTSRNNTKHMANTVSEMQTLLSQAMTEVCGTGTFSTDSVVVELISPDACDLTVVDLPGIIRTVTAGQSTAVIEQVNKLIKAFLLDPRTIILAVVPANQDIATVDILDRAQGVDPGGERTIGVLTKSDLVSPGGEDEVLAVANNIRKPLRLGYVMLRNRSQREIMNNISASKAK